MKQQVTVQQSQPDTKNASKLKVELIFSPEIMQLLVEKMAELTLSSRPGRDCRSPTDQACICG